MDLSLSEQHRELQSQVRAFIRDHGHKSPKVGGGRKRPDQKTLDWQKLLVEHGYVGRTIPHEYGGFGVPPDVMEAAVIAAEFDTAGLGVHRRHVGVECFQHLRTHSRLRRDDGKDVDHLGLLLFNPACGAQACLHCHAAATGGGFAA